MARNWRVDVVILTALGLEYEAVRGWLTDTHRHTDASGTRYEIGALGDGAGRVALAAHGEGNLTAAAVAGRAIDEFGPRAVIFVGVAGGLRDSVALGDVVVATRVHAYHGGRDEPAGFRPWTKSWPLAHALEQAAREVARANTWSASLPSKPAVHFKPIVSGEVVMDTRESDLARRIAERYSDAVAADMESAGIAEAAHRSGKSDTITVRGVSDNADGDKRRADADGWQPVSAANAAAFAAALAERIIQTAPSSGSDREPATSQANVHAGGSLTMKRSFIAGGNVSQTRNIRIGLGGAAAVVAVVAALVITNQVDQGATSPPARGMIVTRDGQVIAKSDARLYPDGPTYAAITGFLSPAFGSTGLERAGEDALKSGNTLALTVDSKTQRVAYDAVLANNVSGAAVAIRPQTGEILAMVSTPSFDPNLVSTNEIAAAKRAYQQILDTPGAPMLNRVTSQYYPPGATFMLVGAAAALEDGKGKDTQLPAAPRIKITATAELRNFNEMPCGPDPTATLELALVLSCNTAFATLAHDLGEDKLVRQAAAFGVGESDLTVPLPVISSCIGVPSRGACMNIADDPALYQTGIGQRDVRFTPLQNAMIAATIANGGMRMRPQLIKGTPESMGRAMTERSANMLRDMMVRAEDRTGGNGKSAGLRIASKTGNAETGGNPSNTPPMSWYVAFAPADDPKIAVAVLVESKQVAATGGALTAAIGRAVINQALAAGI